MSGEFRLQECKGDFFVKAPVSESGVPSPVHEKAFHKRVGRVKGKEELRSSGKERINL